MFSVIIKGMTQSFNKIVELVHRYLRDPEASWCVATYGAIAEFHIKDMQQINGASCHSCCFVAETTCKYFKQ